MPQLVALPARPSRLSPKLRRAIDLRVRKMLSIAEACQQAGLSTAGWYEAMQRPAVQGHLEAVRQKFIAESANLKAAARTMAYERAIELLTRTKNESIKLRLIEFLAGKGKGPQVAVHVNARSIGGGYEYPANLRSAPGKVVEGE
jgi:hypothetical protein